MKHKLIATCLALLLGGSASWATDFESGVLKYTTLEAPNTVSVAGYAFDENEPNVVIPETVTNGGTTYTVTEISTNAFLNNTDIKSVSIPGTVKMIGSSAFSGATNLAKATIAEGCTSLGNRCFMYAGIESITIPSTVTRVWDYAFSFSKLKSIVIPATVDFSTNDKGICKQCPDLTTVTFAEGATVVPEMGFMNCFNLKTVTLPASMLQIKASAFKALDLDNWNGEKPHEYPVLTLENLTTINCAAEVPPIVGQYALLGLPATATINVPTGSEDAYKAANGWKDFTIKGGNGASTGGDKPGTAEFVMPTHFCAPEGATMWSYAPSFDTKVKHLPQLDGNSTHAFWQKVPAEYKGKYIIGTEWEGWVDENGKAYTSGYDAAQITNIPCTVDSAINTNLWSNEALVFDHMLVSPEGTIRVSYNSTPQVKQNGSWVSYHVDIYDKNVKIPVWDVSERPADSFWAERGQTEVKDYSATKGPLAFRVYMVDKVPAEAYDIAVLKPDTIMPVIAGERFQINLPIVNCGWRTISSFKFTYTIDGKSTSALGNCKNLYSAYKDNGLFGFNAIDKPGTYKVKVELDRVGRNDIVNGSKFRTVEFYITVLPAEAPTIPDGALKAAYGSGAVSFPVTHDWYDYNNPRIAVKIADPAMAGMKVLGLKIPKMVTEGTSNINIWTSVDAKESSQANVTRAYLRGDSLVAFFDQPVTVPEGGLFVGVSFDNIGSKFFNLPVWEGITGIPNSGYYSYSNSRDLKQPATQWAVAMEVYMSGDVAKASVLPGKQAGSGMFQRNAPFNITADLYNYGSEAISNLDYTVTLDGVTKQGHTEFTPAIPQTLLLNNTLKLPMEGMDILGEVTGKMTIDKVNGQVNPYATTELPLKGTFLNSLPVKRPIMEEGTGTTCGWCPRGMVAMAELHRLYGDDFIAAAYHRFNAVDPMYNDAALPWGGGGFPCASIDRGINIDPFTGASDSKPMGVLDVYQKAADNAAPASIEMATVYDKTTQNVSVDTEVEFAFLEDNLRYTLGYIVTIDSLSHPKDKDWRQENYYPSYPDQADNEYLKPLLDGSFDCNTFNHVVIECSNYKGVKKSIPGDVKVGDIVKHHVDISLADNELMEKADHVHVICLLLDENNAVKNARQVKLNASTKQSGIGQTVSDTRTTSETIFYDLMGRRVVQPGTGIFIRVKDGKADKVIL